MLIGVGVSCRVSYSNVSYSYVSCEDILIIFGKRESSFFCYRLLVIMHGFSEEGLPLPLDA